MVNSLGETIVDIDGNTGSAMFGKGAHRFNPDGSFDLANGNFLYNLINGLLITGKFESNKDGNRIVIDPETRMFNMYDNKDRLICGLGFEISESEEVTPSLEMYSYMSDGTPLFKTKVYSSGVIATNLISGIAISLQVDGLKMYKSGSSLPDASIFPGWMKLDLPPSSNNLDAGYWYVDSSGYVKIKK